MRVAVLGVGLIGGSIGLAAKARLGAAVAGFDPDTELLDRALELEAIDVAAGGVEEACRDAEIVFCAAPVGALHDLARAALAATGPQAAVTDVGSVKRSLIARLGSEPRFVGGHPLAGAETSGVDSARAGLFEGARWYLTPTPRTEGLLYDRVQRAVAELGARPQAIEAEAHDRLMATVSHLPHVLANVLVTRAEAILGEEPERLPEVGPSFRDATRVAGANPAIWGDIFAGNRDAVAAEVDAVAAELREVAELMRAGDRSALARWHAESGRHRRRLLEADLVGGPLQELRVMVVNRPGVVAELALTLGRAGVNIEDMALHPATDMSSGAISLYIAGEEQSERAASLIRDLGHEVFRLER